MQNREIKFRLCYTSQNGKKSMIYSDDRFLVKLDGMVLENYGTSWNDPSWESVFDADAPPIIQQCIGVLDKNNKEIYEGDIVNFQELDRVSERGEFDDSEGQIWKKIPVVWHQPSLSFRFYLNEYRKEESIQFKWIEIVGNIFENPNLL